MKYLSKSFICFFFFAFLAPTTKIIVNLRQIKMSERKCLAKHYSPSMMFVDGSSRGTQTLIAVIL